MIITFCIQFRSGLQGQIWKCWNKRIGTSHIPYFKVIVPYFWTHMLSSLPPLSMWNMADSSIGFYEQDYEMLMNWVMLCSRIAKDLFHRRILKENSKWDETKTFLLLVFLQITLFWVSIVFKACFLSSQLSLMFFVIWESLFKSTIFLW